MKSRFIILIVVGFSFYQCDSPSVQLTHTSDPDIWLVNIGQGNRTHIAQVLQKIDSLQPAVIGIDIIFAVEKKVQEDSSLLQAFKQTENDILIYWSKNDGGYQHSLFEFTSEVDAEGYLEFQEQESEIRNMTPIVKIGEQQHESFALKIIRHWKPAYQTDIKPGQSIPINYTRSLERYMHFDGEDLINMNVEDFDTSVTKNKIILLGFTGPGNENKFFTPIRYADDKHKANEPDTYGLVIIANQIRTLLDREKK